MDGVQDVDFNVQIQSIYVYNYSYFFSQALGERLPMEHPQLYTLYEWVRQWASALAQGALLDVFPALRFFNNENYNKIITARRTRKEQMDPLIEMKKVMFLVITLFIWLK